MQRHIVQTGVWAEVKNKYGTKAVEAGGVIYTLHKIPLLKKYFAYCPRVNPENINFEELIKSLKKNNCVGLTFDVPNIIKGSKEEQKALEIFKSKCTKAVRSEFAKANVLIDLTKTERELFEGMHSKHRYNTRYALKNGVVVELAENDQDFEDFFIVFKQTAIRQKYFVRGREYYKTIWDVMHPEGLCEILIAKKDEEVLAAWMVFVHDGILYYPYGGSTKDQKNLFASNALGWEVIRYGKTRECRLFDMWGAAEDPEDTKDEYYGFTNFKLKFGGTHIKYIDSFDLVINPVVHFLFTRINNLRWKLLESGIIK